SNAPASRAFTASTPSDASVTWWPICSTVRRTDCRTSGSSSTIRTRAMASSVSRSTIFTLAEPSVHPPVHARSQVESGGWPSADRASVALPTERQVEAVSARRRECAVAKRSRAFRAGPVLAYGTRHGRRADNDHRSPSRRARCPFRHRGGRGGAHRGVASHRRALGIVLQRGGLHRDAPID